MTRWHIAALAAVVFLIPSGAFGQTGHRPESSPYRDLAANKAASVVGGYLTGSRGSVGVGPSNGPVFGARYEHSVGAPADVLIGISVARLTRYVVDPSLPVATRTSGPIDQDILMMEAGMSLILMGRKTWRGFGPFIGGTLGVGFETGLGSDQTQYQFGTKVVLTPHAGVKWFPVQALAVRLEGRVYTWRLSYPPSYSIDPTGSGLPTVLPSFHSGKEWTLHPTVLLSIGYTFAR